MFGVVFARADLNVAHALAAEALFELPIDQLKFRFKALRPHFNERFNALYHLPKLCFGRRRKDFEGEFDASVDYVFPRDCAEGFRFF